MKSCFRPIFFNARWLAGAALALAGLLAMAPAQATGDLEPMTSSILSEPGSAGLGTVVRIEASPYREVGNRYDLLPLYLYQGERFFLHVNRGGVKLGQDDTQRLDLFVEQRLEGFPVDRVPASLAGMGVRDSGIDLGLAWRWNQPWGTLQAELLHDVG
ncbi:MAG: MipA/OmpV family protein, partial [Polaromonas sp.]